jgi:hypothetical protein
MHTKKKRKPRGSAARDYDSQLWTVPMCARWAGLVPAYIRSQIRAGVIEAVAVGDGHDHALPNGAMCRRSCAKFLVVAKSFKAFVEGLSKLHRLPGEAA